MLGLLAGFALTIALAVLFWETSPVGVLLILRALYAGGAGFLCWRLHQLRRDWHLLPATLDQLRKDRKCLEEFLG